MKIDRSIAPEIKTIENIDIKKATEYKLDNGIKVFAVDAGSQEVMRTDFVFNAGICHQEKFFQSSLTNSLMKEGTKNYSSEEIANKLDFWGTFLGMDIDKHSASISFFALHKFYPESLELIEDIIKKPTFPQEEFDIKLQQRQQGFKVRRQKVETLAIEKYFELLFSSNHPYGNKAEIEDFDKITIENLKHFHQTQYHSNNVYILMAGKDPKQYLEILNQRFGQKDWAQETTKKENNYKMHESPAGEYLVKKEDAQQSAIRAGMQLHIESNEDYNQLLILNMIYGGYFGSRLMQNLREDKGFTYGISSYIREDKEAKMLLIATDVGVEYTKKSIAEIKKELAIITKTEIDENELELAKRQMLGQTLSLFDGPFAQIDAFQYLHELNKDYDYYQSLINTIKNTTAQQLLKIAQKYFSVDKLRIAVAGQIID